MPRSQPQAGWASSTTKRSHHWRLFFKRRRRLLAALCLCAAAALSVQQLTPEPLRVVDILTATRDLPAGTTLGATDVAVVKVPQAAVAPGTLTSRDQASAARLATPLRQGQAVSTVSLIGPGLLVGTEPGTRAVPVRLSDPAAAELVSPGQLVTLVLSPSATGDGTPAAGKVLAQHVAVLWKGSSATSATGLLATSGAGNNEGLLVVAAAGDQAVALAAASASGKIFLVLEGSPAP